MDSYEATKMVFSRIQSLDPENASKIMGCLLLQDHGDKEMIRLAFGPETLLHNLILQAKTHLGFSSNTPSTPSTPSSPSPFNPTSSRPSSLSISSSRITSNNNGFDITNPSSPSSNSWPLLSPNTTSSLSYASIVNGTSNNNSNTGSSSLSSTMSLSNAFPYYNSNSTNNNTSNDLIDEYQLQDHFSFLNDSKTDELFDPRLDLAMSPTAYGDTHLHRRSFSVPGLCFGSEDANSGLGWKPCLYFARGFCKNGTSCRFLHGGESGDGATLVGSPSKLSEFEQCQELLRSKAAAAQQQKLAAASQFMTGASFPYNKCMNLLLQQQNDTQRSAAAAALMMGEELHKFGRCRPERNDFSAMGLGGAMNPGSRQIYLTFPADSTFREEDVSNYFSIYGPVQDVRIPYQQKRMFGFVTFVYPETVKLILAKGNPHFVCDSRVLVKPYKEKGKVPDKKQPHQQQQMERGDYSACSSPSGLDSREPFDLHLGARMFQNTQEMLLRRKLEEQAELQQAIELQGRRLMNLQLLDFKNHNHHQFLHGLSTGSPVPSPTPSRTPNSQTLIFQPDGIDQEVPEENGGIPDAVASRNGVADGELEVNPVSNHSNGNSYNSSTEEKSSTEENDLRESLEHILPDNLFTSPKKSAGDNTVFSTTALEVDDNAITSTTSSSNSNLVLPTTSTLNMTSLKTCFLQIPRFSSGHGTIGM
ncbi:zinc finger CCCH domain-containing protein 53 isoform X2 [Ricinus communis]|uniref:Nucleic acid binding protein, putative n=1 Tax=Ricinus communis TaxID=3988 RepID=B9RIF6_RICCO|nr:zinc finger CCCH domain-containing protein 53 isoform X2 [Ricinus communis]EEF48928.1 nucleic acid binding protein, putative [Ricinus communis]|eukprot:XP_002513525.1 zinc finger CCCH domain-containing protein 53 isoform X2 [Ricinus communis]